MHAKCGCPTAPSWALTAAHLTSLRPRPHRQARLLCPPHRPCDSRTSFCGPGIEPDRQTLGPSQPFTGTPARTTRTPAHPPTAVNSEDLLMLAAGVLKAGIKRIWEILKHASGGDRAGGMASGRPSEVTLGAPK